MKKIELSFDPQGRRGGLQGCYRAHLNGCRGIHAAGKTPAEAVGDLFITHPDTFGKRVERGWERVTSIDGLPVIHLDALIPGGQTALGTLVLEHPDVFGVEIVLLRAHLWPVSKEPASCIDI